VLRAGEPRVTFQCMVCGVVFESGAGVIEHLSRYRRPVGCPTRLIIRGVRSGGAVGARADRVLCSPQTTRCSRAPAFVQEVGL
jgi:hypothetical protein